MRGDVEVVNWRNLRQSRRIGFSVIEFHPFDARVAEEQKSRLQKVKSARDENKLNEAMSQLELAARDKDNVMPHIIAAVRSYATVGEITKIFKKVFGEFEEPISF